MSIPQKTEHIRTTRVSRSRPHDITGSPAEATESRKSFASRRRRGTA